MAFERVGVRVFLEGVARFTRDAERVRRDISGMGRTARGLTAPFRLAGTAISKFAGFLGGVARIAGGIIAARLFMGITRGLSMIAGEALRAAAEFQKLEIRFEGLIARELAQADATLTMAEALKMAQEPAQELLEWIKKIAVTTPFTVESLSNAIAMAQAMGFNVEKSKELTKAIGNFTAGMGLSDEAMQRIIYNFGQMIQQGKVTGTELRDLARGSLVPVTDVLHLMQEQLGDTRPWEEFREAAAKGQVPVEAFFEAFITLANRDFPGAMERMSMTWQGVTSNIKDFIQAVLGVDLLGPVVDRFTRRAAEWLQRMMTPEMRQQFKDLGETLGDSFDKIMGVIEQELIPAIKSFFSVLGLGDMSIGGFAGFIEKATKAIADFISMVSGFITLASEIIGPLFATLKSEGETLFEPIIEGARNLFAAFKETLPVIKLAIHDFLNWIRKNIAPTISGIVQNVGTILNILAEFWREHGESIMVIINFVLKVITTTIAGFIDTVVAVFTAFLQLLKGDWRGAWETIMAAADRFLNMILSIVGTNLEEFKESWRRAIDGAKELIRLGLESAIKIAEGLISGFKEAGKKLIGGIVSGIKSKVKAVIDAVKKLAKDALEAIRRLLDFGSPSKAFERIGRGMMEGLTKGILDAIQMPELAVSLATSRAIAPAMAASPISRTSNTTYNYSMNINTRAPVEPIIADFRTLQSMAGAI